MDTLTHAISWMIIHSLWLSLITWALLHLINAFIPSAKTRKLIGLTALFAFLGVLIWLIPTAPDLSKTEVISLISLDGLELSKSRNWLAAITLWINNHSQLLSVGWLIGASLALLKLGQSHRTMKRLQLGAITCVDGQLNARLNTFQNQLGISRKVILKVSGLVNSPMCVGFFKPIIYLPLGLSNGMKEDELDAIILHELAHIRHGDFIINYVLVCFETAFFFNPTVLLMIKELRQEMEYACDDLVTQNQSAITYSRALLKLQELQLDRAWSLAANHKNSQLKKRINRMINSNNKTQKPHFAIITLLLAMCLISTAFTTKQEPEKPKIREVKAAERQQTQPADTLYFEDREALKAKINDLGFKEASQHVFMLNGKHIRLITDANNSLKKGEQMMEEIQEELVADGLLNPNRPKMTLMFQYSDLLNGEANLGKHYEKYKAIFNRYFPKYDSYACTRVFRYQQ